jgi:hypothetical protein
MKNPTLNKAARAKITRAKDNLHKLELEFQQFSNSKPYKIKQEHDLNTDEFILVYYPVGDVPADWSVIIGEILFNLRSALDLAVHELTVREQGTPLKLTEFPIFDDKNEFFKLDKKGLPARGSGLYKIRGLKQKTVDCIEALQPYNTRETDKEPIISLLHEMNIIDKHRELLLCRQMAHGAKVMLVRNALNVINWGLDNLGGNLDERAVIARLKLAGGLDDKVYMDADVIIEIAFDEKNASAFKKNEGVIKVLQSIITGVERILFLLEDSLMESP